VNLIAVAILVASLALSAPPSAFAVSGDHFGALVHPIFPHVHGDGHALAPDDPLANLASHEPASRDIAPGLSVPLGQTGAPDAAAGIVLPFALLALMISLTRALRIFEPALAGRPIAPPTPPPRLLTSIA
jgi:hypothetical protein